MGVIGSSGGSSSGGGSGLVLGKPTYQTVNVTRTASSPTGSTVETVIYTAAADSEKSLFTLVEFQNTTLQDAGSVNDPNFFNPTNGDYFGPKGTVFNYPITITAKSSLLSYDPAPSLGNNYLPTKSNVYATGTVTTNGSYQTGIWSPSSNTTGVSTRLVDRDGKVMPYMYNGTTWQQWSPTVLLYPGDVLTVKDATPNAGLLGFDLNFKSAIKSPGISTDTIKCSAITSDGKIIVGGFFTQYGDTVLTFPLVQLNSDGTIDTDFNLTSSAYISSPTHTFAKPTTNGIVSVNSVAIDSNGDILVGGEFTCTETSSGATRRGIIKIKGTSAANIANGSAGTVDSSFMLTSGIDNSASNISYNRKIVHEVKIDSNNKILICGLFDYFNGLERRGIARLNADGSLDTSFLSGGGGAMASIGQSVTQVFSMGIQSDGKIWVVGDFPAWKNYTSSTGSTRTYMAKLMSDGQYDSAYVPSSGSTAFDFAPTKITMTDDICWVSGGFTKYSGSSTYLVGFSGTSVVSTSLVSSSITATCTVSVSNPTLSYTKDLLVFTGGVVKRITSSSKTIATPSYLGSFNGVTSLAIGSDGSTIMFGSNLSFNTTSTYGNYVILSGGMCKIGYSFYDNFYGKQMAPFVLKITKVSSP